MKSLYNLRAECYGISLAPICCAVPPSSWEVLLKTGYHGCEHQTERRTGLIVGAALFPTPKHLLRSSESSVMFVRPTGERDWAASYDEPWIRREVNERSA